METLKKKKKHNHSIICSIIFDKESFPKGLTFALGNISKLQTFHASYSEQAPFARVTIRLPNQRGHTAVNWQIKLTVIDKERQFVPKKSPPAEACTALIAYETLREQHCRTSSAGPIWTNE